MRKLICLLIFCFLCINPAYARWASFDDAAIKFSRSLEINVDKDGRVEQVVEMEAEILKESGRSIAARYVLTYNGDNTRMEVIEAKTVYKGKEYKIDNKSIEDQPLASASSGFDQYRQILLAFPKPEIGAKIYLKYKSQQIRPELKNFYSELFTFGDGEFVEKERVKLQSKLPLHILINDPEKVLKIIKDKKDNFHNLEITLTRPLYKGVIGEPKRNILNTKYTTYVSLSTLKTWQSLASSISIKGYAKIFKEPLPKTFMKIAGRAARKKSEVDQINTVTSLLNDKIQYIGDWRSVEGRLFPRTLEQTSKTQLGDCKDFAAATAAILAKLGYKTQVAWVSRGIGNFYPRSLPDMGATNHAIVKVTNKHGKVRWIDPTNFVSMANGIFPDIAGKKVLVLDSKHPSYEEIPNVDPKHAQIFSSSEISILNDSDIAKKGEVILKHEQAFNVGVTGAELRSTKKTIKNGLFRLLSGQDLAEKDKISMILPSLRSRIVKNVLIKYSYRQEDRLLKTNLGAALKRSYSSLRKFFNTPEYYVKDILVSDNPFSTTRKVTIENVKVKNIETLNKEIKSPWVYVRRHCNLKGHDLHIEYNLILYKNLIPNEEIRKPAFIKLKKELGKNFQDVAIIFNRSKHS